jgi:hypothetical protein
MLVEVDRAARLLVLLADGSSGEADGMFGALAQAPTIR